MSGDKEGPAQTDTATVAGPVAGQFGQPEGFGGGPIDQAGTTRPSSGEEREGLTDVQEFQFDCLKDARYHDERERFYASLHKGTMFLTVAGGAAVFTQISHVWVFACIITLAGLVDLVFDVSGKARLHASLRRRFYDLLAQSQGEHVDLRILRQQQIGVFADEPTCMHAVNAVAYNGAMSALDRPRGSHLKITSIQRMLRHWIPFASTTFPRLDESA